MELRRNRHHVFSIMYHFVWIPKFIKSISAREFFRIFPKIKRKYFCGGKLWTQSFFVETVENYNENTVREYVKN